MPIDYDIPTFEQTNPNYVATQKNADLLEQIQKMQYQKVLNQYEQPTLEESLKQAKLNNQILEPQAQYAPQMTLADLVQKQNQGKLTGEQAKWYGPTAQSNIGLQGSQTNLNYLRGKYLPLDEAIKAANSARQGSRFGDAFQFAKVLQTLPADQRAIYIQQNPEAYQNLLDTLGNKTLQQQVSQPQQVVDSLMSKMFPGVYGSNGQQPSSDYSQNQVNSTIDSLKQSAQQPQGAQLPPQISQGQQPPQGQVAPQIQQGQQQPQQSPQQQTTAFGGTSDAAQKENFANGLALAANVKLTGPVIRDRANNTMAYEAWALKPENRAKYVPMINEAIEYAGVKGKGKKYEDAWLNEHPHAIASYDWYTKDFSLFITNATRFLEKMGATDTQVKEMDNTINVIDDISSNPQRAKAAINNFMSTMQDVGDGILVAAEPVKKGTYRKAAGVERLKGDYTDLSDISGGSKPGMVKVKNPDGLPGSMPADKLDAALKAGYTRM